MIMPVTKLAEKDAMIERRIPSTEEWNEFLKALRENYSIIDCELTHLYELVDAEKLDGANLRISKASVLAKITKTLASTMESCEFALKSYILNESQKIQIDEHMFNFEDNLVWFMDLNKENK